VGPKQIVFSVRYHRNGRERSPGSAKTIPAGNRVRSGTQGVEAEDDSGERDEKADRKNCRGIKEVLWEGLNARKRAGRVASPERGRVLLGEVGAYQHRKVRAALDKRQTSETADSPLTISYC
jgi:hypothetical protein